MRLTSGESMDGMCDVCSPELFCLRLVKVEARFHFGNGLFFTRDFDPEYDVSYVKWPRSANILFLFHNATMIEDRTKLYIGLSFVAGILVTLGFKDVYPDLERRYHQRRRRFSTTNPTTIPKVGEKVALKDNTDRPSSTVLLPQVEIPDGIEGCIGNTPLFRIKSLSDATGCEILAKAEVCLLEVFFELL